MSEFWKNKRVLITGHTGFKGSWLCMWLTYLGADVIGYSLEPPTNPSLFQLADISSLVMHHIGDIRDLDLLKSVIHRTKPEIVIHMAAQPLVRESYKIPHETFEINVMGTVCILEAVRTCQSIKAVVNVTTDKVYENRECARGYMEEDSLGGYDPYAGSKACSEIVTASYRNSYFTDSSASVATARAGNVIGGGDFASDRLVPDCVRSVLSEKSIKIRNPHSIRPWQHVLEPLHGYLMLAQQLYEEGGRFTGGWNIGPSHEDCCEVGDVVKMFCEEWGYKKYELFSDNGPHEAKLLILNCEKAYNMLGWRPKWSIKEAVKNTVKWTRCYAEKGDLTSVMIGQIKHFMET